MNGFDFFVQAVVTAPDEPKKAPRKVEVQRKRGEFKEETLNGVAFLDETTVRPRSGEPGKKIGAWDSARP